MSDRHTKELLCDLLRVFYTKGWVSGTGGGICGPTDDGNLFLAPTGVHKERIQPDDFFVVSPTDGSVVVPAVDPSLRPSECTTIFCTAARASETSGSFARCFSSPMTRTGRPTSSASSS